LGVQVAGLAEMGRAIGASGAVSAVLILFVCHFPHAQVRLYFFIPMPAWLLAVLYVGWNAVFALGSLPDPRAGRAGIAYFAHLGGAALGLLYFQSGVRFSRIFDRPPKVRARPKLRVLVPPPEEEPAEPVGAPVPAAPKPAAVADEQLEAKLDKVLEKVSKHGRDSLTPEEREILVRASELYKNRRK
jgi:hypothetical protein